MQYKIPVQIENEDPIFLWLWLKQLMILMVWWGIAFKVFEWWSKSLGKEVAIIPAFLIFWITVLIAVFKHSEMTFIPFVLAVFRNAINPKERRWYQWVDSFQPMDIWYIVVSKEKSHKEIDFSSKKDKLNSLEDNLDKI